MAVAVECIFTWYWLADLCAREKIPFVLGHALYMKAIHGGKAKNDRIDAHKIAALLRGGMIPEAYVYPQRMRSTRDLLRRRMHLMRQRAERLAHIQNTNHQYNLPPIGKKIAYKSNRDGVAERFVDPGVREIVRLDLERIGEYDRLLTALELQIVKQARPDRLCHAAAQRGVRHESILQPFENVSSAVDADVSTPAGPASPGLRPEPR